MEHLMSIETTILSAFAKIAEVPNLQRMRNAQSSHFIPTTYPIAMGPKDARCTYDFFQRLTGTRLINITIRSDRFLSNFDLDKMRRWAESRNSSAYFGNVSFPATYFGEEWEFRVVVKYSLPLAGLKEEVIIEVVTELLRLWQEVVTETEKQIKKAAEDEKQRDREARVAAHKQRSARRAAATKLPVPPGSTQAILNELNQLVGIDSVKHLVNRLVAQQKVGQQRAEGGLKAVVPSPHLVFAGNPGTGKTTVARLVGKLYKSLGLLSKGHVVEVDRSTLVAGYVGQTALKTREACEKARGGVLFIDEAYSLVVDGRDYGTESIETILTFMEANRGDIVVVAAGYPENMTDFLDSNPGLRGRFDVSLLFDDFSVDELLQIFDNLLSENQYDITETARGEVAQILARQINTKGFANARYVRSLFNDLVGEHAASLAGIAKATPQQLRLLTSLAIPQRLSHASTVSLSDLPPLN
jgi:SpoVK/Ycf46/Vps4 family AAA+-type ATPase